MSTLTSINLSTLPPPDVVEVFTFEEILASMLADLQARDPAFSALVESDPAYKILEVAAYRETLIRQRVNDAAHSVMLAYATGADLDQLAALFGVARKVLVEADPDAIPPIEAVYEADADFRLRIPLSLEGTSTAGPEGAYQFHALRVATIKDAAIAGPPEVDPGEVRVTVLSFNNTDSVGATTDEVDAVEAILNEEDVRPLTDLVTVQAATMVPYTLAVTLYIKSGYDFAVIASEVTTRIEAYCASVNRIGYDVRISGIYAASMITGVEHSEILDTGGALDEDLIIDEVSAPYFNGLTLVTTAAT